MTDLQPAETTSRGDPRAEFDSLLSDALDALGKVVDDGELLEFWTAHRALNLALGLILTHRWDAG